MKPSNILKTVQIPLSLESRNYIYPEDFWEKVLVPIIEKRNDRTEDTFPIFVTFADYDASSTGINLMKLVGELLSFNADSKLATINLLDTPLGNLAAELLDRDIKFALFPSGRGNTYVFEASDKPVVEAKDFELFSLDLRQR